MAAQQLPHGRNLSNVFGDFAVKIGKEVDKTKRLATEKVIKPEPTAETKEMMESFTLFQAIESRINTLSDGTIDSLYDAQESITMHSLKLSETLLSNNNKNSNHNQQKNNLQTVDNKTIDLFANFTQNVMGRKLFILNTMTRNGYLIKMEKQLINPINIYKNKQVTKTKQLIEEYKNKKFEYDLAVHKNKKKEDKRKELDIMRFKVMENIKDLKIIEENNLLNCFKKYWQTYSSFLQCQSEIINLKDFMETQYDNIKFKSINDAFETTKLPKYKCGIPNVLIKLKHVLFKYKRHLTKCIFRLGCVKAKLKSIQELIDQNKIDEIDFEQVSGHIIAALIKIFYRDLPTPIFSHISLDKFVETKIIKDAQTVIDEDIPQPYLSYYLFLLDLVIEIAKYKDVNSMSANNLCIVIAPNLYNLSEVNTEDSRRLVQVTTALITFMSLCVQSRIEQSIKID